MPSSTPVKALVVILAILTSALTVLPAATAAVADDSLTVRLVDAPADRRDDPRARVYIVDHVRPGTVVTRRVEVTNHTDQTRRVTVYAGPASIRAGEWAPEPEGARSDLTDWTQVGHPATMLAPGASVLTPVTITVPRTAGEGERYGVIWAQTTTTRPGQVTLASRVGIRIYLSVGPGGEPATAFTIDRLTGTRTTDALQVTAAVTNTGQRAIDLTGDLRLADGPGGLSAGPYDATLGTTLAPGDTGQVDLALDPTLPVGPWRAVLTLRTGNVERVAEADLTFPKTAGRTAAVVPAGPGDPGWPGQHGAILGVAGMLGLLLIVVIGRRRRRRAVAAVPVLAVPSILAEPGPGQALHDA